MDETRDTGVELALGQTLAQPTGEAGAPAAPLATGAARYTRGRELGRGGMGRVFEAVDTQFQRSVAIKEVGTGTDKPDDASVRRFNTEAIVTGHLEHPGIPAVYERGVGEDGRPFYAMRRVQGRTLAKLLVEATTREQRLALLGVVTSAAQTIAFAHHRGVVHRDIKPDNILVGEHGETFVLDWGIARVRGVPVDPVAGGTSEGGATIYGSVVGTPAYMAPEQAAGELDRIDERTDVFALGALLYHLLAGHAPYRGDNLAQLVTAARHAELPELSERGLPSELVAICRRATAREPGQRYRNAAELARALQDFSTHAVIAQKAPVVTLYRGIAIATLSFALLGVVATFTAVARGTLGQPVVISPTVLGVLGSVVGFIDWWTRGRYKLGSAVFGFALATFFVSIGGAGIVSSEMFHDLAETHPSAAEYRDALAHGLANAFSGAALGCMIAAFELAIWAFARRRADHGTSVL